MKRLKNGLRRLVQRYGILAVVGVPMALLVGAGGGVWYVLKGCSVMVSEQDIDRLNRTLGKVESEKDDRSKEEKSWVQRVMERFEKPGLVGGQLVEKPFEGSQHIRVVDYSINCMYPPFSIGTDANNSQIIDEPPNPLPAYCHPTPTPIPIPTPCSSSYCPQSTPSPTPIYLPSALQSALQRTADRSNKNSLTYMESVGALKLRPKKDASNSEFWASGFMIAEGLFATSCHVMEPLLQKDKYGRLEKDNAGKFRLSDDVANDYDLVVDFTLGHAYTERPHVGDKVSIHDAYEIPASYGDCSDQTGLDVALLVLNPKNNMYVPPKIPLLYSRGRAMLEAKKAKPAALITYVDLSHPIDEITSEMYAPFADPEKYHSKPTSGDYPHYGPYWKFAMFDGIVGVAHCSGVDFFLDRAGTSVGSSGALVLDIFLDVKAPLTNLPLTPRKEALAIGIHKCCAAYFGEEEEYGPPPAMACAELRRSPWNQDVTTTSILNDPKLCLLLKDKAKIEDNDGNSVTLTCSRD
jgi:hypothetical protein